MIQGRKLKGLPFYFQNNNTLLAGLQGFKKSLKGIVLQNFLACHPDVIPPRRKSDNPNQNSSFSP
jgi:hypothetical protein